ncbi:complement factor H-related protein 4-like [Penaeus japonicus]|uniref:complement factor H-related protein 4-like n=1 Tax=Penaeus japonicus TaxID=27405 RepID=UPI001C710B54|nr:complement factor H-related protein 4-like [Penaeus japonicus]
MGQRQVISSSVLQRRTGDWTLDGLYEPEATLTETADLAASSSPWLYLTTNPDAPLVGAPITGGTATAAVCQLYGLQGCWADPPPATANMTFVWDNSTAGGAVVTYTCLAGYFVDGNSSVSAQNITCLAQLGGWFPALLDCYYVEGEPPGLTSKILVHCYCYWGHDDADDDRDKDDVIMCLEEPPLAPSPLMTNFTSEDLRYVGGFLNFTCPDGMATLQGNTSQEVVCQAVEAEVNYAFVPALVKPCNVCLGEPLVANATTDWDGTVPWETGTSVTATCLAGYALGINMTSLPVNCTETGWEVIPPCYEACVDPPPDPTANMTRDNVTDNALGTILHYNCSAGFHIVPTPVRIMARNNIEKICAKKQNVQRKLGIRQFISSFTIATSLLEIVTHWTTKFIAKFLQHTSVCSADACMPLVMEE